MIITIDGPAGTGKTTIAKKIAEKLHFAYFDTGAMYRAVTWQIMQKGISLHDISAIEDLLKSFSFQIAEKNGVKYYYSNGIDITTVIRSQEVTARVSDVSALLCVRAALWKIQRDFAEQGDSVFEGRDLGSVVFPHANIKIFLTARPEVRAKRRLHELLAKDPQLASALDAQKICTELEKRDTMDSGRQHAPLVEPQGAYFIDTSDLSIDEVVSAIIAYTHQKRSSAPKKFRKGNLLYRSIILLTKMFFKLFYRHRVYGLEHFMQGGAIIAANHCSFFDPPMGAISSPEEVHFLARESLFKIPLFGGLIRALNSHPVRGDAGDVAVFKTVCELLNQGKKVLLFPEGTRASADQLGEIKPGIGLFISRTRAFIQPLYIHGTFHIWNRFHKFPRLSGRTASVFGSPIRWESFSHLSKREAHDALCQQLVYSLAALREWYESGAHGTPP